MDRMSRSCDMFLCREIEREGERKRDSLRIHRERERGIKTVNNKTKKRNSRNQQNKLTITYF